MKKENEPRKVEKKREIIVEGWCAFNEVDYPKPPIDEISFERTRELAYKNWKPMFYGQVIRKCKVIINPKKPTIPIRVLSCGHEREQSVIHMLRVVHNEPILYQKAGDNGYCRICMKPVKIIRVKQ